MTLRSRAVLARLKQAARSRAYILSVHALSRAKQRTVTRRDIEAAFLNAHHAEEQDNGNWRITGSDEDGDELHMIIAIRSLVEVITVF